ncbi:MAG: DEAD/DEAH box helicase [Oligoflexia bacterium]|nr:DEAD/DEAH box helicase [Oligoflexia bacterium]
MSLLDQIRDAANERVWSRGVTLARSGSVLADGSDQEELRFKVVIKGASRAFDVFLWPVDGDWGCDCGGPETCVHICAAAIWNQHRGSSSDSSSDSSSKHALPAAKAVGHLGYRLRRDAHGLTIDRVLRVDDQDRPGNSGPAAALRCDRAVLVDDCDRQIERVLGFRFGHRIAKEAAHRVWDALQGAPDLTLDGEAVRASGQPVVPIGRVEDDGTGFKVRIVRDRAITAVLGSGTVLCQDALRPIGTAGLTREKRDLLARGVHFPPDDVGRLVSETIPALQASIPVEIRTRRLPTSEKIKPRLLIETWGNTEELVVKPRLVYGNPPSAEVDRGELKLLGGTVPIRDEVAERRLVRRLGDGLQLAVGLERRFRGESAVRFAATLAEFQGGSHGSVALEGAAHRQFRKTTSLTPDVHIQGNRLLVSFKGAEGEADASRVLEAWQDGAELAPLIGGGWAPIPWEWLQAHGKRVADLLAARDEASGQVARGAIFDLARLSAELDQPPPPGLEELRSLLDGFDGIPHAELPEGLQAELRPYQQQGVNWLRFLQRAGLGGILADDMGLGKTLEALCAMESPALVVCPTSVLPNWAKETARFRPNVKVHVYHGPQRKMDLTADVVLTTYGVLRIDVDKLKDRGWKALVLDEAQAIKNPDSKVARAAYKMNADWKVTLTGTPVENRLDELWSQIHFCNPGLLGGRRDFQERYAKPIARGEPGSAAHLRERIKPFVLRRLKEDVAPELPPRTDNVLYCELSRDERLVYDAVRAATMEKIVAQVAGARTGKPNVMAALEALLRLRQASCHSGLVPGQEADHSSKLRVLMEALDELLAAGHKALVFSQWTSLLDRVEPHLHTADIDFVRLDGSTRDRQKVVDRFQDPDGPPVFLISLKAGGTGLNLTNADHVFLLDPWWNPAAEDQAADRAHRIGQDKPVLVYRLVAENTVEERILALQERKRRLANAALGDADQATAVTRDELMALLA